MQTGLIDLAELMVTSAQRRLEAVSSNVSNLTTPGYRSSVAFGSLLTPTSEPLSFATNFAAGPVRSGAGPLDLALAGEGFFRVRGENGAFYTRAGQFSRDREGRVADAQGLVLQTMDGADLIVSGPDVEITSDGFVLENGAPVARVGVFEPDDNAGARALVRAGGAYFTAPDAAMREAAAPLVRQGMIEGSNVELSAEMLTMMNALRQAEAGARVVQTYDSLLGQTISTLGRVQA